MAINENRLFDAIEGSRRAYIERTPKSRACFEASTAFPGGSTRSVLYYPPYPVTIVKGEGSKIWDADGHCYADVLNEYSAGLFGHSNAGIMAALAATASQGISFGGPNLYEARLAAYLVERFPSIERVRFCNSGTEANIAAIQLALHATGREGVLVFQGGYHGSFLSFPSGPTPLNVRIQTVLAIYNDVEALPRLFDLHGASLGACIVEPIMAAGGAIPATHAFLKELRRLCTEHGVVLIFDEVVSSRLSLVGMQGVHGVLPDLTTLGKYVGGGLSFGAFGGRAALLDLLDMTRAGAVPHAGTFNNNVLSMACGLAAAQQLTDEGLERINRLGDTLREGLASACSGTPIHVTGYGSLSCIHLGASPLHELFHLHMLENGFYMARRGSIYLSLESTSEQVEGFVAAARTFCDVYGDALS